MDMTPEEFELLVGSVIQPRTFVASGMAHDVYESLQFKATQYISTAFDRVSFVVYNRGNQSTIRATRCLSNGCWLDIRIQAVHKPAAPVFE